MHTTLRLLATGWIAATAATALGQNSHYVGDLRSLDRELLNSAAVAPGYAHAIAAQPASRYGQAPVVQTSAQQEVAKPRETRKRTTLFGMLTSWTRGSDEQASTPPAPSGEIAGGKKPRPGSKETPRPRGVAGSAPAHATRWTQKENPSGLPLPAMRVDRGVTQASGTGLPLPIAPATQPGSQPHFNAPPQSPPTPQVVADPAILALANAPDPQATPLALRASDPAPPIAEDELSLDGVVFVTDAPTPDPAASPIPVVEKETTVKPTTEQIAQATAETPAPSETPAEPAVVLAAPPEVTPPEVTLPEVTLPEVTAPEAMIAKPLPPVSAAEPAEFEAVAEVSAAPLEEELPAQPAAPPAVVAEATMIPAVDPTPVLSQPALSPSVVATDGAYPAPTAPLATERTAVVRQQPRIGLPPRRPAPEREPSDRAKMLLTEAHHLASDAASAEDYTAIVQRCRYVLAFDKAPQAVAYAHELGAWSLNCRGEVLMEEGRVEEAEADFYDALLTDTDCWRAEHNLGVVAMRRGDLEQASRRFHRTLELNPEFAKAYSNRAAIAVQDGDFDAAMRDYEQAIEADPDLAVAHTGRGRLCHMLGQMQQALRHLDAAALLSPDDPAIAIARGDLLVDFGRYGHARSAYERAIKLNPDSPIAYRNLAWLQATCPVASFRDGDAALRNAERAAELSEEPDDIALDTYAAALAAAGRYEEAAETQLRAAEMAPESDAEAYLDRLALYLRGEAFTSRPIGEVIQAGYTR